MGTRRRVREEKTNVGPTHMLRRISQSFGFHNSQMLRLPPYCPVATEYVGYGISARQKAQRLNACKVHFPFVSPSFSISIIHVTRLFARTNYVNTFYSSPSRRWFYSFSTKRLSGRSKSLSAFRLTSSDVVFLPKSLFAPRPMGIIIPLHRERSVALTKWIIQYLKTFYLMLCCNDHFDCSVFYWFL